MGYLNIGFSKEFYEREERKDEMIYKAQIIQSVYKCDKEEIIDIKEHFDGKAYYKVSLIEYYYYIDGLTIIITSRNDYVTQEKNDELKIQINNPEKVVYNSMKNIYEQGEWEKLFENIFKTSFKIYNNQKTYVKKV